MLAERIGVGEKLDGLFGQAPSSVGEKMGAVARSDEVGRSAAGSPETDFEGEFIVRTAVFEVAGFWEGLGEERMKSGSSSVGCESNSVSRPV